LVKVNGKLSILIIESAGQNPLHMIAVRIPETISEYEKIENIQREIWMMHDNIEIIPLHVLVTAQKNGGLVAAAYDERDEMIGMLFGFVGLTAEGTTKHCSHLMGVLPGVRRQSVGQEIKLFQRRYVLEQGLDLVTWTFDPLEGVNASLNIAKLGGVVHKYHKNIYGNMPDALNSGLPTDRFEVEWRLNSPRVRRLVEEKRSERSTYLGLLNSGAMLVNEVRLESDGALYPVAAPNNQSADTLLVEVPPEFQAVKAISMDLARQWRAHTGEIFQRYFARGYTVVDFLSERLDSRRRNFYVLSRHVVGLSE
jgi:predicted GNAT superfamily acetyltransferase